MKKVNPLNLTLKDGTKVKYIGEVVNGYAHGQGKMIYDDGGYEIANYINNEPNGPLASYSKDGNIAYESHFQNGVENGIRIDYNEDTSCRAICFMKNDEKNGIEIFFMDDGSIVLNKYVNNTMKAWKHVLPDEFTLAPENK